MSLRDYTRSFERGSARFLAQRRGAPSTQSLRVASAAPAGPRERDHVDRVTLSPGRGRAGRLRTCTTEPCRYARGLGSDTRSRPTESSCRPHQLSDAPQRCKSACEIGSTTNLNVLDHSASPDDVRISCCRCSRPLPFMRPGSATMHVAPSLTARATHRPTARAVAASYNRSAQTKTVCGSQGSHGIGASESTFERSVRRRGARRAW